MPDPARVAKLFDNKNLPKDAAVSLPGDADGFEPCTAVGPSD